VGGGNRRFLNSSRKRIAKEVFLFHPPIIDGEGPGYEGRTESIKYILYLLLSLAASAPSLRLTFPLRPPIQRIPFIFFIGGYFA
jgi:hypothetical protein